MKEVFKNNLKITLITVLVIIMFIGGYLYFALNGYLYNDTETQSETEVLQSEQSQ